MRSAWKVVLASSLLAAGIAAGLFIMIRHPSLLTLRYDLTLATGPVGSEGQKVLAAFMREMSEARPFLRLKPVAAESLRRNGELLTGGQVDLAVIRSDDKAAAYGRTIFVLRQTAIGVLIPPESKIEKAGELAGKRIAVARGFDPGLLRAFREFYSLREADLIEMPPSDIGPAMRRKQVVATVAFGPIGPGPITDAFASIQKSFRAAPSYLDIAEADAIAARWPAFQSVEIKQGTYGGTPPEPAETINTFTVQTLLVSRASLSDRLAGELTRLLIATKAKLVIDLPAAAQMAPPDTERSSLLPVHPGSLAYLNGEQEKLLDETLNYYWLAVMVFAVFAPLAGLIASRKRRRRRDRMQAKVVHVIDLAKTAKDGSADQLAEADAELDRMTEWLFEQLASQELEREDFQFMERLIAHARSDIQKRLGHRTAASELENPLHAAAAELAMGRA